MVKRVFIFSCVALVDIPTHLSQLLLALNFCTIYTRAHQQYPKYNFATLIEVLSKIYNWNENLKI